jgi:hypothetical protein
MERETLKIPGIYIYIYIVRIQRLSALGDASLYGAL